MSERKCTRREFIKGIGAIRIIAGASLPPQNVFAGDRKPNILFIAVDDLRPELGCYGHKLVQSPNIDRLAREGTRFNRAYCQEAICSPSRTSLMTGLRPDSSGVVDNVTYFRDTVPDVITLPQYFRSHGYETVYIGKIYHGRMRDEEKSWSRKAVRLKPSFKWDVGGYQLPENQALVKRRREEVKQKYGQVQFGGLACGPAVESADVPDDAYQDGRGPRAIQRRSVQQLPDGLFYAHGQVSIDHLGRHAKSGY